MVIVLALCLIAFEWTSGEKGPNEFADLGETVLEEELIPITEMQEQQPETPPKFPR
ncbi:MAG: hypothetical protein R2727_04310 [Bacteroidales bacterium]